MKSVKRALVLNFLLLLIIPIAFAEITITLPEKNSYNLGDKIVPEVSIKVESDYDGFFKLLISCDNYNMQYYTIPLSLEANLRVQLTVPELSLSKSMATQCNLKSNFDTVDGENVDTEWSKDFFVTDELDIILDSDFEAEPGKDVVISGKVTKKGSEVLPKGEAKISFKGKEETVDVANGKFEHAIHLSVDTEAGNIPALIAITDRYGNYGNKIVNIRVLPIPTRIGNSFENNILTPGDILKAKVVLYDHTDKAINGSKVNVRIFAPDKNLIAEKDIQSMNYLEFEPEKTQMPGNYILLSSFGNIKEQSSFEIKSVRKIIMNQEGYFVYVENAGNVNYKDELTIVLESNGKKYLVNKKIDLELGEKITIDLSKEVPQGTYDITLPENLAGETTGEVDGSNSSEGTADISGPVNVIKDVSVDDNRNIIKKTADGMSSVTGAVVGAAGYVASRPILASGILILIIIGTVAHYSWGFIKTKVKGKKEDDTGHLFEDFKFDEENK